MKYYFYYIVILWFLLVSLCSPSVAEGESGPFWSAREDNGDKPSIEYRVWNGRDGKLTGEMWVVTIDENGKDKERGIYPVTIAASNQTSLSFIYKSGNGDVDEIRITFQKVPNDPQEKAVLEDVRNRQKSKLVFERMQPSSN